MKIKYDEKYFLIGAYSLATICLGILFFFLVQNFFNILGGISSIISFFKPFIIGFVIAFLLKKPFNFIEEKLKKYLFKSGKHPKILRGIAFLLTIFITITIIVGFISFLVPQITSSIPQLQAQIPAFTTAAISFINEMAVELGINAELFTNLTISWEEILDQFLTILSASFSNIVNVTITATTEIIAVFFGIVVSIYMLLSKERFAAQGKKLATAILPIKVKDALLNLLTLIHDIFNRYIIGQITDAAALGVVCFILMSIIGFPYAALISIIIAITNIIPYIGPFIGAIPSVFLILMSNGITSAFWFIVFIIVLQQIDGNILNPRIIGQSTGLTDFWVVFAIFVGGGIGGLIGVIIAVPCMAIVYTLAKSATEKRLAKKGLPTDTADYR